MPASTMMAPPKRSLSGMFQMRGGVQRTSSSQSTVSLGGCDMDAEGPASLPDHDDTLWLQLEGGLFGSACGTNTSSNEVSPSSASSTSSGRSWFGTRKSSGASDAAPPPLDADQFLWDADPSSATAVMHVTPPHS